MNIPFLKSISCSIFLCYYFPTVVLSQESGKPLRGKGTDWEQSHSPFKGTDPEEDRQQQWVFAAHSVAHPHGDGLGRDCPAATLSWKVH